MRVINYVSYLSMIILFFVATCNKKNGNYSQKFHIILQTYLLEMLWNGMKTESRRSLDLSFGGISCVLQKVYV